MPKMYENDSIFDRFDVKCSPSGRYLSTGAYNESFSILDIKNGNINNKNEGKQL